MSDYSVVAHDGVVYGPVDEATLISWAQAQRVQASTQILVAETGLTVPAASLGFLAPYLTQEPGPSTLAAPAYGASTPVPVIIPTYGVTNPNGGNTPNAEIMTQARGLLSGRWGLAIGTTVLFSILGFVINGIPTIGAVASLVLTGPLTLGFNIFILRFSRRQNAKVENIFEGFRRFGSALAAYLLMSLFIFLWCLLLFIPGIIAALSYSMTYYILADNPSMGASEAIAESKRMMKGYKWKLFCLGCRFIGWGILSILTLSIGLLWLYPYMYVSVARFYDDLRGVGCAQVGVDPNASANPY